MAKLKIDNKTMIIPNRRVWYASHGIYIKGVEEALKGECVLKFNGRIHKGRIVPRLRGSRHTCMIVTNSTPMFGPSIMRKMYKLWKIFEILTSTVKKN